MFKIAKQISKMTTEELKLALVETGDMAQIYSILQEALRRKTTDIIKMGAEDPLIMGTKTTASLILKYILNNIKEESAFEIMKIILNYPKNVIEKSGTEEQIKVICISNPKISALALLSRGTPTKTTEAIVNMNQLNDCKRNTKINEFIANKPPQENQTNGDRVLINIIWLIRSGYTWNNDDSGFLFLPRLSQNANDSFMTEIAKADIIPSMALGLLEASKQFPHAKKFSENLKNNESVGVVLAKGLTSEFTPELVITGLISMMQQNIYEEHVRWIWQFLNEKFSLDKKWLDLCLDIRYNGQNLLLQLAKFSHIMAVEIFNYLYRTLGPDRLLKDSLFRDLLIYMINDPSLQNEVFKLPRDFVERIKWPADIRKKIEEKYHPKAKEDEDMEDTEDIRSLLGNNNGWYKYSATLEKYAFLKEAGWFQDLRPWQQGTILAIISIISSISAYFEAGSLKKLLDRKNVPPIQQEVVIDTINKLTNQNKTIDQIDKHDIDIATQKIKKNDYSLVQILKEINKKEPRKPMSEQKTINTSDLNIDELKDIIRKHEGKSNKVYLDPSKKNWCVGHGFNLNKPNSRNVIKSIGANYDDVLSGKQSLSDEQVEKILDLSIKEAVNVAKNFVPNYNQLPPKAKLVLADMAFMGEGTLNKFIDLRNALVKNNYDQAANEMLDSLWAKQVGKRATELAEIMRSIG
jgi:lysozyme